MIENVVRWLNRSKRVNRIEPRTPGLIRSSLPKAGGMKKKNTEKRKRSGPQCGRDIYDRHHRRLL